MEEIYEAPELEISVYAAGDGANTSWEGDIDMA